MSPSKDPINARANEWMTLNLEDRVKAIGETSRAGGKKRRAMSAQILRLASRLDVDPDELAKKIDPDTLRRTKYPVIETVDDEGKRSFRHDHQVEEGPRALHK